jgi:hypothetical protein
MNGIRKLFDRIRRLFVGPVYTIQQESGGTWSIRRDGFAFEAGFASKRSAEKFLVAILTEGAL